MYDENYYKTLNYADYLSRQERYDKLQDDICGLLSDLGLLKPDMNILDYGCAVGFLVKSFQDAGYKNTHGYDISDWAKKQARDNGINNIWDVLPKEDYDLVTALDVFEHMGDKAVKDALLDIDTKILIVRIPVAVANQYEVDLKFHLEVSRRDPTHINCKTAREWEEFITRYGMFRTCFKLNLHTIYDSPGVFCAMFVS